MSKTLLLVLGLTGCFVTSTETGAAGEGPDIDQHQWFTGWGSVRLSDAAGAECSGGLARVDSGIGLGDLVIDGALAVVTGFVGTMVCPLPDHPTTTDATTYASCTALFSGLGPVLLARKTVRYRCLAQR
jgi:hypothetical protein